MTTIYHNPRCSKSRQTLALLQENCIEIKIVLYLEQPPSADELNTICNKLSMKPVDIVRHKEKVFKELGLSVNDQRNSMQWCQIMADNPILIERPIVIKEDRACIGRPPQNVLDLLQAI